MIVAALTAALIVAWRARYPLRPGLLVVHVALILLYFWSLDESYHVTVRVSRRAVAATVAGDTLRMSRSPAPGAGESFGLQASDYESYRIQATGEAIQGDTRSVLGRMAVAFRLAGPGTAWSHLRLTVTGASTGWGSPQSTNLRDSWRRDARGDWTGSLGAYVLFPPVLARSYTLDADLVRPDGTQSLILGVDGEGRGYALQIRLDQPDALLVRWRSGTAGDIVAVTALHHVPALAAAQRDVRLLLTGYLYALILAAIAVGLYPFVRLLPPLASSRPKWPWVRFRRPRGVEAVSLFLSAVVPAGILATGLVASGILDRIPHVQDDVGYLFQAKILALGRFNVPAPPLRIQPFFQEEFVPFHDGKWFSQYPPGHPLMLMLGVLAGAPWMVEPILASLGLGCVFLLGRRVYSNVVGALAALLGLSSPFWLFLGSSMMSHATGMFFAAACMLCFAVTEESTDAIWPFLTGLFAGMTFITRELTALGLLLPFAAYALLFGRRSLAVYSRAAVGLALPLGFLLAFNWADMGNPLQSTYAAWSPYYTPGFTATSPGGPFTFGDGLWNAYQNLSMLAVQLYGWPYCLAFALPLMPFILGAARRWDYLLLASCLGLVVAYVFYWCACLMYGPRFYYEALPPLLLLSARGVYELARLPARIWRVVPAEQPTVAGGIFPAILLAGLLAYNVSFYFPIQIPLYQDYNYSSADELRAVARARVHHAIVFVVIQPNYAWWAYGNVFFANDPLLHGDIIYARDNGTADTLLYPYFPGRAHYRLNGTSITPIR